MSEENTQQGGEESEAVETLSCCASCGIAKAKVDDIQLVPCDDCDLVRYCSDECRAQHKSTHEEECKKRTAELRDELLFKQPESSHLGDCPICCLPLPPDDPAKTTVAMCCSKTVCNGCRHASDMRQFEQRLEGTCPFCRDSLPNNDEDGDQRRMKRIEANDPVAIFHEGGEQYQKGNYSKAYEYWAKAAALGDAWSHNRLAHLYHNGEVVEKDEGKAIYHWEEAAIGGHPEARYNLGCMEWNNGNDERAVNHWIIAATHGYDDSIKALMRGFKYGYVEKEELAAALRAHQAAVDATKSPMRKEAEKYCFS